MAVINTFQLAARKNLIQMSSDAIETVTVATWLRRKIHLPYSNVNNYYNRQVTHNSHLYKNQDFHVLKITNLTFKTDI
jgi:hypothetical protein